MEILRIKNFGSIGEDNSSPSRFFEIKFSPVTVFIGPQSSGKSTVVKVFASFIWLEKALVRGDFSIRQIQNVDFFKRLLNAKNITKDYFSDGTMLEYIGMFMHCRYDSNSFSVELKKENADYNMPKIQYIPSERNLLAIMDAISRKKIRTTKKGIVSVSFLNLPSFLDWFNDEYWLAMNELVKEGFDLPVKNTKILFENKCVLVKHDDNTVPMACASSGVQSLTPLVLVSKYLSEFVQKEDNEKVYLHKDAIKEQINLLFENESDEVSRIFDSFLTFGYKFLPPDGKYILKIKEIVKKFSPSCFVNIVEEPEQNLFPETQSEVFYELLKFKNANTGSKFIFSTHSPYLLASLNNSILAFDILKRTGKSVPQFPKEKQIAYEDVSAFKCVDGRVDSILDDKNRLVLAEEIDDCANKINSDFDLLLGMLPNEE